MRKEFIIYLIGISILGLFYYEIKFRLDNDLLFVILGIVYVVALSLFASRFKR